MSEQEELAKTTGTSSAGASPAGASPAGTHEALRQRAEMIARAKTALTSEAAASLTPEEMRQLFHELRVHQIELEMQNEELHRSQIALEASRARYFDLYDLAPVGYFTLTPKGIIQEANLTASVLLGVPRDDLVKRPFAHFILPGDQDIYYGHTKKLFDTGAPQTYELRLKRTAIAFFWVTVNVIRAPDSQTCRLVINDITRRKEAEKAQQASHDRLEAALAELKETQRQLVQQERLAAVGQLAAGIAHDFNNILAVIMLQTDLCLRVSGAAEMDKRLQSILQQAEHAATLVQQVLDFGGRAIIHRKPLDLASFLQDQVQMLNRLIPESIRTELSVLTNDGVVQVDQNRLQQVIINLVLNARDVMPDGGQLFIRLERRHFVNAADTPLPEMPAGEWVQITVQDTGVGIQPEVLPHIFEPFFTTREPGEGTGLGLAQVYGIVRQHHGYIHVHTIVGQGSAFMIYLPAAAMTGNADHARQAEKVPGGHGEIVLIVEDNTSLRQALVSSLEGMNYTTRTAVNGVEALAILEEPAANIAIVLSDMVMPEMSGDKLFRAMQQRGLRVPMLILSGHPMEAELIQVLMAEGLKGFFMKPPNIEKLMTLIAQIVQQEVA